MFVKFWIIGVEEPFTELKILKPLLRYDVAKSTPTHDFRCICMEMIGINLRKITLTLILRFLSTYRKEINQMFRIFTLFQIFETFRLKIWKNHKTWRETFPKLFSRQLSGAHFGFSLFFS